MDVICVFNLGILFILIVDDQIKNKSPKYGQMPDDLDWGARNLCDPRVVWWSAG